MQDIRLYLDKLRDQTAECALIRDLATDSAKRDLFAKLALHFKTLGDELERATKAPANQTPGASTPPAPDVLG